MELVGGFSRCSPVSPITSLQDLDTLAKLAGEIPIRHVTNTHSEIRSAGEQLTYNLTEINTHALPRIRTQSLPHPRSVAHQSSAPREVGSELTLRLSRASYTLASGRLELRSRQQARRDFSRGWCAISGVAGRKVIFESEEEDILLDEVPKFPCLYDLKCNSYRNLVDVRNAWEEILGKVGRTGVDGAVMDCEDETELCHDNDESADVPPTQSHNEELSLEEQSPSTAETTDKRTAEAIANVVRGNAVHRAKMFERLLTTAQDEPIELFFKRVAQPVKTFTPRLQREEKQKIMALVDGIEGLNNEQSTACSTVSHDVSNSSSFTSADSAPAFLNIHLDQSQGDSICPGEFQYSYTNQ
ncbi:hypothetical protein PR048_030954 [Dryococelus australis]|uniref:MADF domain-containing protein n=1 Tax=Dryococelus australis TaxID=614101 RepID=A0ABQ9GAD9_9NEOP|nr:hypothetical protein PR048_030954 [Dryococelus australis]